MANDSLSSENQLDAFGVAHSLRICDKCHAELDWAECYNCEEGYSDHDCGEDCCCCLNPEPNVRCDICLGKGGWWACPFCHPGAFND